MSQQGGGGEGRKEESGADSVSGDRHAAMAGWKARKEQLYRQKESVDKVNDEAEKVNLLSLSKKRDSLPLPE